MIIRVFYKSRQPGRPDDAEWILRIPVTDEIGAALTGYDWSPQLHDYLPACYADVAEIAILTERIAGRELTDICRMEEDRSSVHVGTVVRQFGDGNVVIGNMGRLTMNQ